MIQQLTADYQQFLQDDFLIYFNPDICLKAVLIRVDITEGKKDTTYSLTFRAEQEGEYYKQGTYKIEHDSLGEAMLFLVPLGPGENDKRILYEVVLNIQN